MERINTTHLNWGPPGESKLPLLPETEAMEDLLIGVLTEHNIDFERQDGVIWTCGPSGNGRTVALLRQILSEPARRAVGVVVPAYNGFPVARPLDDWWHLSETGWFDRAVADDRFETWFQPIVDTTENCVFAHECLIRLNSVRLYGGLEILRAARIRGQLQSFDGYARRLALRSVGRMAGRPKVMVNFIPATIYNPDAFVSEVSDEIDMHGLLRQQIVLEAVGSDAMLDHTHLGRIADLCRRRDIGFSLDDVGVGATAAKLTVNLRPDFVKLDRRIVENVERPAEASTVRKLVEVAARNGSVIVAKGVEKTRTVENLWLLGVQCMQGYLFGRAVPQPEQVMPLDSDTPENGCREASGR